MNASCPLPEIVKLDLCLDFANTVSYRRSTRRRKDWLVTNAGFIRWCGKREIFSPTDGERLTEAGEELLVRALRLRESLYGVFSALAAGRATPREAMAVVGDEFAQAIRQTRIDKANAGLLWKIEGMGQTVESGLWPIAISAALLLASEHRSRVRECADDECGWLFLDTSKNRSRKWCSMSDCGNLAKARRHYGRRRGADAG